ncbi:FAM72 protein-domain-containing protein [Rhodocollybia butyracea]|uniref:FAM72 protein-domain-containing protein n=1 Tax=Rhodocollybia butyracea TaxID=206335 RepID=A0A9P5PMT6_9AGAR|nr:FAM72 protein-domain-containing protein [Rhodocollybia butyracea]
MHSSRYVHLFPAENSNYAPPLPIPQPVAHRVWIIDCRSCGSFLTNRGMKAVLLLRPTVPLYSSDALPANCSVFTSNPEAIKPPTSCRPQTHPSRTCECLTQSLCCHGCGSTIGYHIVIPCVRCTSSISANNRATNGHRFVFHSSEVVGFERHYVSNEPGVIPYDTVSLFSPPQPYREMYSAHPQNEYLPTPPLDVMDLSPLSSVSPSPIASNSSSLSYHDVHRPPPGLRLSGHRSPSPDSPSGSELSSPPPLMPIHSSFSFGMPAHEQVEQPLREGDVIFWHHLVRHGEIPGVFDDPRARKGPSVSAGTDHRKTVVCGR